MHDASKPHSAAGEAKISPLQDLTDASPLIENAGEMALLGSKCMQCGVKMLGRRIACSACMSTDIESVALATGGTLYSWTRVHVSPVAEGPVCMGYVDLDDGVRTLGELRCDGDPKIGAEVRIKAGSEGAWWFEPAAAGEAVR